MESTERFNCLFHHYPEKIQLSNSRRAKYHMTTDPNDQAMLKKFPKYIIEGISKGRYQFAPKTKFKDGITRYALYDNQERSFVVKNKAIAGTPLFKMINSQDVWESGSGMEWHIRKLKDMLTAYYTPNIVRQLPERIVTPDKRTFIHLEYIFFYPFVCREPRTYQDYLNHFYVRGKIFEDTLVKLGVIEDDSPQFLRGAYARYVNVNSEEDRRLEIKIHFCKNGQRIS